MILEPLYVFPVTKSVIQNELAESDDPQFKTFTVGITLVIQCIAIIFLLMDIMGMEIHT